MISLLALSLICLISIPVLMAAMAFLAVPFAIIWAVLPWLLRVAAFLVLIRALVEKPLSLQSMIPAALLLGLSVLLR